MIVIFRQNLFLVSYIAIAQALGSKVYVDSQKKRVLDCLEDGDLKQLMTVNKREAAVHVARMGVVTREVRT